MCIPWARATVVQHTEKHLGRVLHFLSGFHRNKAPFIHSVNKAFYQFCYLREPWITQVAEQNIDEIINGKCVSYGLNLEEYAVGM